MSDCVVYLSLCVSMIVCVLYLACVKCVFDVLVAGLEFSHVPHTGLREAYDAYSFYVIPTMGQVVVRFPLRFVVFVAVSVSLSDISDLECVYHCKGW